VFAFPTSLFSCAVELDSAWGVLTSSLQNKWCPTCRSTQDWAKWSLLELFWGANYAVFASDHPLALTCLPLGHLPLISAFHESSLESKRMWNSSDCQLDGSKR
jgi:hypothetical protein